MSSKDFVGLCASMTLRNPKRVDWDKGGKTVLLAWAKGLKEANSGKRRSGSVNRPKR